MPSGRDKSLRWRDNSFRRVRLTSIAARMSSSTRLMSYPVPYLCACFCRRMMPSCSSRFSDRTIVIRLYGVSSMKRLTSTGSGSGVSSLIHNAIISRIT